MQPADPTFLAGPAHPLGPKTPRVITLSNFKDGETQKGSGEGSLMRVEQGTEIKRERQDPETPEAALRPAFLGSRTGGTRPRAGASQGQVDPRGRKQKAH